MDILQPKGTVLKHKDGSLYTADGSLKFNMDKWTVVSGGAPAPAAPTPAAPAPAAPTPSAPAAPAKGPAIGTIWEDYYRRILENPTATESAKAEARRQLGEGTTPTAEEETTYVDVWSLEHYDKLGKTNVVISGEQYTKKGGQWYRQRDMALVGPDGAVKASTGKGEVPDWLDEDEQFQELSPDDQDFLTEYFNVLKGQDEENQKILAEALQTAKAQADPYFAEKIRMAQDELTRALGQQTGDFGSQKRDLELRIEQIGEDLVTGKGRLSVDQQAELGRQKRNYEYQLENLVEGAASKGLTFSTKRALAESRLATEQTDIVESTKREFQRRITDLQTAASRGEVSAQNLLKDYERMYGENVTALIRGAESQVGTEGLPTGLSDLPGLGPLGGVVGSFAEEKQMDILQRAEALANLNNPFL